MTEDLNQELAVATEELRAHWQGMIDATAKIETLADKLGIPFLADDTEMLASELIMISSDITSAESNVTAYFSLRAGGRR